MGSVTIDATFVPVISFMLSSINWPRHGFAIDLKMSYIQGPPVKTPGTGSGAQNGFGTGSGYVRKSEGGFLYTAIYIYIYHRCSVLRLVGQGLPPF